MGNIKKQSFLYDYYWMLLSMPRLANTAIHSALLVKPQQTSFFPRSLFLVYCIYANKTEGKDLALLQIDVDVASLLCSQLVAPDGNR